MGEDEASDDSSNVDLQLEGSRMSVTSRRSSLAESTMSEDAFEDLCDEVTRKDLQAFRQLSQRTSNAGFDMGKVPSSRPSRASDGPSRISDDRGDSRAGSKEAVAATRNLLAP